MPSGDNWADADDFAGSWLSLSALSNVGATLEAGEPAVDQGSTGVTGTNSLWWKYTADIDGPITFTTGGPLPAVVGSDTMDTVIDVFTGTTLAGLTLVTTNDDDPDSTHPPNPESGGNTSLVTVDMTAGVTYSIRVTGHDPAQSGTVRLQIQPGPGADAFAAATVITGNTGTARANNIGATSETDEPDTDWGTSSIWFSWTPDADTTVAFDTFGSQSVVTDWGAAPGVLDTTLIAYTGSSIGALTRIAQSDDNGNSPDTPDPVTSKIMFRATAGTTYHLRVADFSDGGYAILNWAPATLPANDDFADAHALSTAGTSSGDTTGATTETDEPSGNATVWYSFTTGVDGELDISVATSGADVWITTLDVYTGADLTGLTSVASNQSSVTVSVAADTVYWVRVGSDDPFYTGPFTLTWTGPSVALTGDESFHTHDGSAYLGSHITTRTGTGWTDNLRSRTAIATIDIGDTTIDGLTFTNDPALLEPDTSLPPPSLPNGPATHIIHRMWLDITGPPTYDEHHQPHAGSWPGTDGNPASEQHGDFGHYRIKVGTKNVTSFRGAQTIITQMSRTDPFGDDTCSLTFPMIGPFEHRGTPGTDLHWLPGDDDDRHIPIKIHHVHPDGTLSTHFEGDIDAIVDGYDGHTGPLVVNGIGVIKTLDDRITKPRFTSDPIDIGRLIHSWTAYEAKYGWHGHPCPARHTGIQTAERGGYGDPLMTTTIQNLLATAQTGEGTKWTIRNHRPRGMRLHVRDLTTVHFSLWCGQPGVTHQLTRNLGGAVRAIFGDGQDHNTQYWRNTQYPNAQITPPHYPLGAGVVFNPGDSHTGFTPFSDELNSRGYHLDSNDTYVTSDANNIRAFQRDAGITVDGSVGPQTWNAAFADTSNANALYAYIRPLAVSPGAEPFLYNGRGGIIGRNPNWDHRTRREKLEQFGTMSKDDARRSAHLELPIVAHTDYAGTVTLTNIDPPELCALSIRDGMNFTFHGHAGADRLLHVAKVDINPGMQIGSARTVTLTTSERGDDYVTLAARLQRNRDVVDASGRRRPPRRSSKRTPDFAPFDSESGAGHLTPRAQFAGLWNVYVIPAGEIGSIVHIRLVADTPTLIAAAVFNRRITARQLTALPGLADPSSGAAGGQDPWTVNAHKLTRNLKYRDQPRMAWATGSPGAMQGYWPHKPSANEDDVTGVLDDASQWDFHSARPPWLWLAVWTRDSCRIGGDPNYNHRALFPGPPQ